MCTHIDLADTSAHQIKVYQADLTNSSKRFIAVRKTVEA